MFKVALLYLFGTALALYPPLSQFAMPFIGLGFLLILTVVFIGIFLAARPIRNTVLYPVVGVLLLVYVGWMFLAILYGNDLGFIGLDSMGFLIYLLCPALYVYIEAHGLHQHFIRFLMNLCTFVAAVSAAIITWYYLTFGAVESDSLLLMNAFIKARNLNWQIDNNNGFLGLYTHTGHLLLLGIGLAYYRYYVTGNKKFVYLILLYCVGIFSDGHRALVVALVILTLLLSPLLFKTMHVKRALLWLGLLVVPVLLYFAVDFAWVVQRFDFTVDDPSTLERLAQVPALFERIVERPWMGNGFGSYASIIRSPERPFSYEVDFLATIMKLGIIGSVLYFGAYLTMLQVARRGAGVFGYILFCVGLAFLFYMGTNGNSAMSTDSSVFHMFIFLLIALSVERTGLATRYGLESRRRALGPGMVAVKG